MKTVFLILCLIYKELLRRKFHFVHQRSSRLMNARFINVRFMEIFYKSLTVKPSVHAVAVRLKGCPLYRVSAL